MHAWICLSVLLVNASPYIRTPLWLETEKTKTSLMPVQEPTWVGMAKFWHGWSWPSYESWVWLCRSDICPVAWV